MAFGGPNQTSTPLPVRDFTPQKSYPSFSQIINQYFSPVTYSNAGNNTLLASDILGGFITHSTGGAQTDTLPTAAALVPLIEGAQGGLPGVAPPSASSGSGMLFYVAAGGAGAVTIAVGTGGTLVGSGAVAAGSVKTFLLIVTAVAALNGLPTYTLYSLGQAAF
jgi:hypothetical protein